MNTPCLHFELNEAWILDEDAGWKKAENTVIRPVKTLRELYPGGRLRSIRNGGLTEDGRFILQGDQAWYYPDGSVKWAVTYDRGRKTGKEFYRRPEGGLFWMWQHADKGTSVWTQVWPDGIRKAQSEWKDFMLHGEAVRWNRSGTCIQKGVFENGRLISEIM
jgi:antitoxin component YwqK of YwqJK toxin-antitoxin module